MVRPSSIVWSVIAGLTLWSAAPVEAQSRSQPPSRYGYNPHRFELMPYAGFQWGGSLGVQGGDLRLKDSFVWGGVLSFLAQRGSAVELTYLRQDTHLAFDPTGAAPALDSVGIAVNYIQIGGRQEFGHGGKLTPFVTGSLGLGIFDPKSTLSGASAGSDTRFSWSLGAGAKYLLASGRAGIRSDLKLWVTPYPSGDYGVWCGWYACTVVQGTTWVTQGQITGGVFFLF